MFVMLKEIRPRWGWLTGPILDKELRVSSRRRRNFWLRSIYVLLMAIFIVVVWVSVVEYHQNAALQQARMAVAGKRIVMTTVLFQFVATQVLAVIMLSTAVSDEVYHRTLGLLMTTPITGLQIVLGKVLSKLLQLLLLLGITLPVLAIVRVFGGVSWEYLLSSFCITLTAVLLAAVTSLTASIGNRRAYAVIVRSVFVLGCFYFALPAVVAALFRVVQIPGLGLLGGTRSAVSRWGFGALLYLNPFYAIGETTQRMLSPGQRSGFNWPLHCAVLLGLSLIILAWAVKVVRRVALRQATGQIDLSLRPRKRRRKRRGVAVAEPEAFGPVKRVVGPPVIWKELRAPFVQGVNSRNSYIGLLMAVVAQLVTYWIAAREGMLDDSFVHFCYVLLFVFMGVMFSVVFSATRVTAERESQTWPILLATPLRDRDILLGKAVSAFRRTLPLWGLLAGHMLLFVLLGYIHPITIVHILMIVAWLTCFITAAGLYFSLRFVRTTSAVVASFTLIVGLWVVAPILFGMVRAMGNRVDWLDDSVWLHPVMQIQKVLEGGSGVHAAETSLWALRYKGLHGMCDVSQTSATLGAVALIYVVLGLLFFWRAQRRLRRRVF